MTKKIISACLCLVFFLSCFEVKAYASEDTVYHWYCVRNLEHKQPTLDKELSVAEKYGAVYLDRRYDDDCQEKVVYLTFDAGYENGNIERILNTLKEEKVSGAFFVLGHLISKHPELLLRMTEEGHLVCNHTVRHKNMTEFDEKEAFQKELSELEDMYYDLTGKTMAKYYRPPEGCFDERSLQFAQSLGYRTVFWSLAYADWDNEHQPDPEKSKELLLRYMHNGAIILLHPTSATNADILKDFIQTLKAQGFRFGSLEELS